MKSAVLRFLRCPPFLILVGILVKIPVLFTDNVQEDSFITWRVARNLIGNGVIGFNGAERISASTTHLYTLISAMFQLLFGAYFIWPLLLFSALLFSVGSWWLSKLFFPKNYWSQVLFFLLLNLTPPALTAAVLGMEYGILFFLYCGLLYYAVHLRKRWAYVLFPFLLLWLRVDTVLFLSIFFLVDVFLRKKLNPHFITGGILGLASVVLFNYFYFGEWVNHTISAKKIAYKAFFQNDSLTFFLYQWAYYGGLLKKYGLFTLLLWLAFLSMLSFIAYKIWLDRKKFLRETLFVVFGLLFFAVFKITAFAYLKAYFDWYYWLPRLFLFAVLLFGWMHYFTLKKRASFIAAALFFGGLYCFQILQSAAVGYMERGQRLRIAADINARNQGKNSSILLEPAGIIPFYTRLYTYDEVGLVNAKVTQEMLKDEKFWWQNTVQTYQPDFVLTVGKQAADTNSVYGMTAAGFSSFKKNYVFVKRYAISDIHTGAPLLLRWIYSVRPIGKDYYLYRKIKN